MTGESQLQVRPRDSDSSLILSKVGSSLIARGRRDAEAIARQPSEPIDPLSETRRLAEQGDAGAQNRLGNAYSEGLGDALKGPLSQAWTSQSREDREMLRAGFLSYEATKSQYELGTPKPETIAPESYTLDYALLNNPEKQEILLDLFMDYKTNVELYQKFHEWLRTSQPPTLVTWGKNDVFFIAQGAEAYKKDVPNAEIHMLDAGHFAGETETAEIGGLILAFFKEEWDLVWLRYKVRAFLVFVKRF